MFKVGDRVRAIQSPGGKIGIGDTGRILSINPFTIRENYFINVAWDKDERIEGLFDYRLVKINDPTIINIGEVHLNLATIDFRVGHSIVTSTSCPEPEKHEGLYIHKEPCQWGMSNCLHNSPHKWAEVNPFCADQCQAHGCVPYEVKP